MDAPQPAEQSAVRQETGRDMTWAEAATVVAAAGGEQAMKAAADSCIDVIPVSEWRGLLVAELLAAARRQQRDQTLRAERAAQVARRRTSRDEWRAWGEQRRAQLGLPKDAASSDVLVAAVDQFKSELKMEWTRELLASSFVLKSGERVTWGDATVAQHKERMAMFKEQARINMDGAERHKLAIQQIEEVGAKCLNEAVCEAA